MSEQEDQSEVEKAFSAIRALCNGELVPPPPRYFNDAGDLMDLHRAAGWVAHALFAPDYDGDNVLDITLFELGREDVIKIPNHNIRSDDNEIDMKVWKISEVTRALETCMEIIQQPAHENQTRQRYAKLSRKIMPEAGEKAIQRIQSALDRNGGRLGTEGEWPEITSSHVFTANIIILDLVGAISDGHMESRCVSRLDPVSLMTLPKTRDQQRAAIHAIQDISGALNRVAQAYQMQDEINRRAQEKRTAEEAAAAEIVALREKVLSQHGDALSEDAGQAAAALLTFFEDGTPLPIYKSTPKHPNPERDMLIDSLKSFLGDDARELLRPTVSEERTRFLTGILALADRLDQIYADPGMSPS